MLRNDLVRYLPAGTFTWDRERRVPYLADRAPRLIPAAGDADAQCDALAGLIGLCWPNASTNN